MTCVFIICLYCIYGNKFKTLIETKETKERKEMYRGEVVVVVEVELVVGVGVGVVVVVVVEAEVKVEKKKSREISRAKVEAGRLRRIGISRRWKEL